MSLFIKSLEKFLDNNTNVSIYYFKAAKMNLTEKTARMKYQTLLSFNAIDQEILKKAKLSFYDDVIKEISERRKNVAESSVSKEAVNI